MGHISKNFNAIGLHQCETLTCFWIGGTSNAWGSISTHLSNFSATAHLKKKYSDKQAKSKSTICSFKNTSTINLFCNLLVRSKVNPKSAQASSPHERGALFPTASSTHLMGSRSKPALWLFGQSYMVHFGQGWPGDSLRHTANPGTNGDLWMYTRMLLSTLFL